MRIIVLAMILASVASGAYALGESTQELTHAYNRYAVLDHVFHRQGKRLSVREAHAPFRYRKGGRCHHYHYYKPKFPPPTVR